MFALLMGEKGMIGISVVSTFPHFLLNKTNGNANKKELLLFYPNFILLWQLGLKDCKD